MDVEVDVDMVEEKLEEEEEEEVEEEEKEEEEEDEENSSDKIERSNNPHLAGGEKERKQTSKWSGYSKVQALREKRKMMEKNKQNHSWKNNNETIEKMRNKNKQNSKQNNRQNSKQNSKQMAQETLE